MNATDPRDFPDHSEELASLVGHPTGSPLVAHSAVNQAMIHHWVEAMGDEDPIYLSDEAARAVGLEQAIAPPTMLQAWTMPGLRATLLRDEARDDPGDGAPPSNHERLMALLDAEGMTSVVATNCDQTYARPLVQGDRLVATSFLEEVSPVKTTGLGTGRFVTTRTEFVAVSETAGDADGAQLLAIGEPVATMRFRILKFRPRPAEAQGAEPRPLRPRPALTEDNAFWFEGTRQHRLLIQRCTACGTLRHPPLPACPECRSFDWDTVASTGKGVLYSFVVVHYPQFPAFDYPLPVGLVELAEGTRLVANLDGADEWKIGMALEAHFVDFDDELTLPVFRPAEGGKEAQA